MVYFRVTGTWLQNVSLKYNSILIRYAILTTILTFSTITNPGTCVLLNDVVNCKEYIMLVVDDYTMYGNTQERKFVPMSLWPAQILHGLAWD